MRWLKSNAVLLYNLPRISLLTVVERILRERKIRFINVRNAYDLFTIPAYLSIIDPGKCQDESWQVDDDELRNYFEHFDNFKCLSDRYFFTRPLTIPVPAVMQERIVPPPLVITEKFLTKLVAFRPDFNDEACEAIVDYIAIKAGREFEKKVERHRE